MPASSSSSASLGTRAATGRSVESSTERAGREAAQCALDALDGRADLAIVFATAGYAQGELLAAVRGVLGETPICGCSGEGVISGPCADERDHAVVVYLLQSDTMRFEPFLLEDYASSPEACGRQLASLCSEPDDIVGVVVFPDGLGGNCSEFLAAFDEATQSQGGQITIAGGTAADAFTFERCYQYDRERALSGACAGFVIRGRGKLDVSVSHGCLPIGLEREVTEQDGGWIRKIDGRPAWDVFREYLDGDPQDLNADGIVHLCIGRPLEEGADDYGPYVIRTPLALDKESGSLLFPGGGLTVGDRVRLTRRDPEEIRASARRIAERLNERHGCTKPALVLQVDCAGRGCVLFGSAAAESTIAPLRDVIGDDIPWAGFHSYGEIAPIGSRAFYHNYSVVMAALYDEDSA